jgi:hypothetical protein
MPINLNTGYDEWLNALGSGFLHRDKYVGTAISVRGGSMHISSVKNLSPNTRVHSASRHVKSTVTVALLTGRNRDIRARVWPFCPRQYSVSAETTKLPAPPTISQEAACQVSVLNSGPLVATIPWMFVLTLADPSLPACEGQRDVPR